ncbi:MAG: heavy metal translocating P-type ATPase [Thermodesulfobacteriota bacterium]
MTEASETATWEVTIEGLDCADCAATLARDIAKIQGVEQADLNFSAARLTVAYDPRAFRREAAEREIVRCGYRVKKPPGLRQVALVVPEMDCADESALIEKALGKLAGVEQLRFYLVSREVRVEYDPTRIDPDRMVEAVRRTGLEVRQKGKERRAESFWQRHRHLLLTGLCGVLIAGALASSWADAPHRATDALYIAAMVAGGFFVAKKGLLALRTLTFDMNFLMTVAVIGAALIEEWLEGATVLFLFSVANLLQGYTMDRARNAIRALMELAPAEALVRRNGRDERVPVEEVRVGEILVVRPGEKIGLDGRVTTGSSHVNQAPITGESMPVEKNPGDPVFAGTLNQNGALEVEVSHLSEDTTLARIVHMVEEAQAQKAPSMSFVEKFARIYTPAVIVGAVLVAAVPPLAFGLPFADWFYRALVLLVIACPCALVISTPVAIVAGLSAAARHGILVKGGVYLEEAGALRVLAFDKTGTLTRGVPRVIDVVGLNGTGEAAVLRLAAGLEQRSEHHLGRAILEEAQARGIPSPDATGFRAIPGQGARAEVDGVTYHIGNHRLCESLGACDPELDRQLLVFERQGKTAVILAGDGRALGILAIADELRPESAGAIEGLRRAGIQRVVMLTGDNRGTAEAIAGALAVDEVHAELMPEDKVAIIERLARDHGKVAMVGDGVNDAPSLAAATVGIAMGTAGTDTALETADVALMTDDLGKLPFLMRLSRQTLAVIRLNIAFALLVKAAFIALAVPGLATLWMAVGADTGATILVVLNGLRLLRANEG